MSTKANLSFDLFELMHIVPVNSYGPVRMLPQFYGAFTQILECHDIPKQQSQ